MSKKAGKGKIFKDLIVIFKIIAYHFNIKERERMSEMNWEQIKNRFCSVKFNHLFKNQVISVLIEINHVLLLNLKFSI